MTNTKFKKFNSFDLSNYEQARNLNPAEWATELHIRHYLLRDDFQKMTYNKKQFLEWFELIKTNGVLKLKDSNSVLSKASEGIICHKDSIDRGGEQLKYAETIRQNHAKSNVFTDSVEAVTVSDLRQFNKGLGDDLINSCNSMWQLLLKNTDGITMVEKKLINKASQLHSIESNNNELALLQIDLSNHDEVIFSDFKKVIQALRKIKPMTTNAKALKANEWEATANRLTNGYVLPYLDLLIHSKLINKKLENDTAQDIIYTELSKFDEENTDGEITQKVQRTIKNNAFKMIELEQIQALRSLYLSKPKTYWSVS